MRKKLETIEDTAYVQKTAEKMKESQSLRGSRNFLPIRKNIVTDARFGDLKSYLFLTLFVFFLLEEVSFLLNNDLIFWISF